MKLALHVVLFVTGALLVTRYAVAEMEHRMGGLPGMPAHMLKPGGDLEHHEQYHPAEGTGAPPMFSFGLPGQVGLSTRTVRIVANDDAHFVPDALSVAAGETVQFELHNTGDRPHELRIGNRRYQREHAQMLKSMPGWEHSSPNSVLVAPGKTGTLFWQFGDDPVVELACHVAGNYEVGMLVQVQVTKR